MKVINNRNDYVVFICGDKYSGITTTMKYLHTQIKGSLFIDCDIPDYSILGFQKLKSQSEKVIFVDNYFSHRNNETRNEIEKNILIPAFKNGMVIIIGSPNYCQPHIWCLPEFRNARYINLQLDKKEEKMFGENTFLKRFPALSKNLYFNELLNNNEITRTDLKDIVKNVFLEITENSEYYIDRIVDDSFLSACMALAWMNSFSFCEFRCVFKHYGIDDNTAYQISNAFLESRIVHANGGAYEFSSFYEEMLIVTATFDKTMKDNFDELKSVFNFLKKSSNSNTYLSFFYQKKRRRTYARIRRHNIFLINEMLL